MTFKGAAFTASYIAAVGIIFGAPAYYGLTETRETCRKLSGLDRAIVHGRMSRETMQGWTDKIAYNTPTSFGQDAAGVVGTIISYAAGLGGFVISAGREATRGEHGYNDFQKKCKEIHSDIPGRPNQKVTLGSVKNYGLASA